MWADTPSVCLRRIRETMRAHGIEDADSTARLMITRVLKIPMAQALSQTEPIKPSQAQMLAQCLARRLKGEPIQYILGEADFYGLTFCVTPSVLIPRMDTETLVLKALENAPRQGKVLDVCTGSGCIALAIKHERPDCEVQATDISAEALKVAKDNGQRLGLDVGWHCGDLCAPVKTQQFDVIVSNPPYISETEYRQLSPLVREYEPPLALLAGAKGLDVYERLIMQADDCLKVGGWLGLEIGSTQAQDVMRLLRQAGLKEIGMKEDLSGLPRVVHGRKG